MEDSRDKFVVSDSDDDINFGARIKRGKTILHIGESDSEEENLKIIQEIEETFSSKNGSASRENSCKSKNSSSDEDDIESSAKSKKSKEKKSIEMQASNTHNALCEQDLLTYKSKNSSSDDDDIELMTSKCKKKKKKKSDEKRVSDTHITKINALCDQDSSSDESHKQVNMENVLPQNRANQRMSAKQAEEQWKVIKSESQRLFRECPLSVPYHKPKQYSIKDFLNRKTINKPVPMALTKKAAANIKMTKEELEQYAKYLEERSKESQEFYRSDSDESMNNDNQINPKCQSESVASNEQLNCNNQNSSINEIGVVVLSNERIDNYNEKTPQCQSKDVLPNEEGKHEKGFVTESGDETDCITKSVNITTTTSGEEQENIAISNNLNDFRKETIEIDYDFGEKERNDANSHNVIYANFSIDKPRLTGPLNGMINLDVDDVRSCKTGRDELFERFIKNLVKRPTRSAKEINVLSTDNGVVEINNLTIQTDDQNCIHSKPRKDCFKLKEELGMRIAAKRKEELLRKQNSVKKVVIEESDSDEESETESKLNEIEKIKDDATEKISEDKDDHENSNNDDSHQNENGDDDENESGSSDAEINNEFLSNYAECDSDDEDVTNDKLDIDCHSNESNNTMESKINSFNDVNLSENPKRRKRIIIMDNSDDEEQMNDELKEHTTDDLYFGFINQEENYAEKEPEKTMSQIFKNQTLADEMIDLCSKIIPETNESQNNISTLYTQAADNISESQLLDLCSGSFVTQATNTTFPASSTEIGYEQQNSLSDNEFSDDDIVLQSKLKQRRRINISDDEEQDDKEMNDEVRNDVLEKTIADESDAADDYLSDEETQAKIVEYDSEENEIEVPLFQKQKRQISDFFENEAELSESEWGSADEDEKNLDKFDMELGDEDEFDQDQLISELDRIHRRRMLDQDAREVKIIKDTHFEDEEENGLGRQRQYKWKHMENSLAVDENRSDNIDSIVKSDDENEETWRRMRYERNNLLQETKNQNFSVNDDTLNAPTKCRKRISIVKNPPNLNTPVTKDLQFLISKMTEEQTHRSSLLIRDKKTLANLAKLTYDDGIPSINTNSKHFLFNMVSTDSGKSIGKRKMEDDGVESETKSQKLTKRINKNTLSVLDKML